MTETARQVRPKRAIAKTAVSRALSMAWSRTVAHHGKGAFADHLESTTKLIDRALTGEHLPELHTALNSLRLDPTSLNEVFALYGFHPPRLRTPDAQNDMHTVSGLSGFIAAFCGALEDGQRDHLETLALADILRPLMPLLTQLLDDANRIRGVEAA